MVSSKTIIVLPVYNEEANIGGLLDRIEEAMSDALLPFELVVIDDGSRDRTPQILRSYGERLPLHVATHGINQGLGAAIRDGLLTAANRAADRDVIITMDADETHTPGLVLRMVRMIREGHDVVIASRYRPGSRVFGVPIHRRVLSFAGSCLFRVLFPTRGIRDFTCGYRAYRAGVLKKAIAAYGSHFVEEDGFQCMVDIVLKIRRMNVVFGEAPLILRYDLKQSMSKMDVTATVRRTLGLALRRRLQSWRSSERS